MTDGGLDGPYTVMVAVCVIERSMCPMHADAQQQIFHNRDKLLATTYL